MPNLENAAPAITPKSNRSLALDALRGLAILLMCVSGITPRLLPNFMYHGNNPQYKPAVVEQAEQANTSEVTPITWEAVGTGWEYDSLWVGMTWVDVVFPMFLFAMGAAIPLACTARLRKSSRWRQARLALSRFGMLVLFAVYVEPITPWALDESPTDVTLWMSVLAFVVLIPLLTRLPRDTPALVRRIMRTTGVVGAITMLCVIHSRESSTGFEWSHHDIIILLLAWSSLAATLLWLFTQGKPWLRWTLGFGLAFVAHEVNLPSELRLGQGLWDAVTTLAQWPGQLLDFRWIPALRSSVTPPTSYDLSSLYDFGFLGCLWLVLPGMMLGDRLVSMALKNASTKSEHPPASSSTSSHRPMAWSLPAVLCITGMVVVVAGLQDVVTQWNLWGIQITNPYTALLGLIPALLGWGLAIRIKPQSSIESLVQRVMGWGWISLALGVLLSVAPGFDSDLFEGGVRKVPGTLSWYFVCAGLTFQLWALLAMAIDMGGWRRLFAPLIGTGQNPMLAYVASRNLLWPLASLPLIGWLTGGAGSFDEWLYHDHFVQWMGEGLSDWWVFAWETLKIGVFAMAIWLLTRLNVVWRV